MQAIIGRPDLGLVGVHAASPNKIGRDAAELCGLSDPTGVIGTDDIDAPRQADDWLRVPLEQACEAGGASLYVNGIDPGCSRDTEVHSALSLVTRARSITVQEIFDYGDYDDYEFTGKSMGSA